MIFFLVKSHIFSRSANLVNTGDPVNCFKSNIKVVQQERDRVQLENENLNGQLADLRLEVLSTNSPAKIGKQVFMFK